jgi:hypothetical protein
VSFEELSFARQFFQGIARRKPMWLLGLIVLCACPTCNDAFNEGAIERARKNANEHPSTIAVDSAHTSGPLRE